MRTSGVRLCLVQSDKVLQSTISTLKELEARCSTAAEQGDMLAASVDDIQHRMGIMQRALMTDVGTAAAAKTQS
jgi:hypothetical protein